MSHLPLDPTALSLLRRRLLAWFDSHARDLPWRHDRDPYRIWVSEVMLQQTTVATVIPKFNAFIEAFPTLAALAQAEEQTVLRHWEGLGYYRRARHLHAAARDVHHRFGDVWPRDPAIWAELPGIGRYILGAVLSQAFNSRLPIVEANSQRVLSRLFAQKTAPSKNQPWLWAAAEEILPRRRVGDFNQAIMELGALVCTVEKPRCAECPLAAHCLAFQHGRQAEIPPPAPRVKPIEIREVAVVIRRKNLVLLLQRPDHGRWSRMWEFPHGEMLADETDTEAAQRLTKELTGLDIVSEEVITTIRHAVTRYRITLTCLEARWKRGKFASPFYVMAAWVPTAELAAYPVSSPQRRLAAIVSGSSRQRRLF